MKLKIFYCNKFILNKKFNMFFLEPYIKFADFTGRSSRKEYWSFVGFFVLIFFILGFIDSLNNNFDKTSGFGLLSGIFILISLLPSIAIGVRRLHDINKSGWWILLSLIPLANLWILTLFFFKGDSGNNNFGQSPSSFDYKNDIMNNNPSNNIRKYIINEGYCVNSSHKTNKSGSSFLPAFYFLGKEKKMALTALYAFCREVDDIVD